MNNGKRRKNMWKIICYECWIHKGDRWEPLQSAVDSVVRSFRVFSVWSSPPVCSRFVVFLQKNVPHSSLQGPFLFHKAVVFPEWGRVRFVLQTDHFGVGLEADWDPPLRCSMDSFHTCSKRQQTQPKSHLRNTTLRPNTTLQHYVLRDCDHFCSLLLMMHCGKLSAQHLSH